MNSSMMHDIRMPTLENLGAELAFEFAFIYNQTLILRLFSLMGVAFVGPNYTVIFQYFSSTFAACLKFAFNY